MFAFNKIKGVDTMYSCALILAAGEGKRMKSDIPKVLHKICGKEMVNHVIDTLRTAGIQDIDVIVGKGADKVRNATEDKKVEYSLQEIQLGTGHAVMSAKKTFIGKYRSCIGIVWRQSFFTT